MSLLYVLFMTISVTGGINNSYSEYDSSTSNADRNINCTHGKILGRTLKACDKHSRKCCLEVGHCMTYDNATQSALIGKCPYHLHKKSRYRFYIELNTSYSKLNQFMCGGSLERNGTLCGKCRNGYGPAVFAQDATCYPCSGHYHGWALYIFFELFFITIFFLIVIFLHISATSESMNAFVFFCQFMVAFVSYGSPVYEYSLRHVPMVLVKILLTVYGFWNLDFFRQVLPPFCVSAEINNLDSLSLQYIAAVYPLCLIFVTYFCIELHGHNFRPVVCCWAPIHWLRPGPALSVLRHRSGGTSSLPADKQISRQTGGDMRLVNGLKGGVALPPSSPPPLPALRTDDAPRGPSSLPTEQHV